MKRKWILAIVLVLVVIAVALAIVLVFVLKDKDTKQLQEQLNKSTTTGYLSKSSEEYDKITEYLKELSKNGGNLSDSKKAMIANYLAVYDTSVTVSDFVNRQMPFTQWTEFYSQNGEKVVNNLKDAQKKAEELKKGIASDREVSSGNPITFANLWNDREGDMTAMVDYTTNAMTTLCDIYTSCVTTKTFNNDYTEVVFKFYKEQMSKVNEELKANRESKGSSSAETAKLVTFVDNYLDYTKTSVKENITNYYNQYGSNYSNIGNKVVIENLKNKWKDSIYYKEYDKVIAGKLFELKENTFKVELYNGYSEDAVSTINYKIYNDITLNSISRNGYTLTGWKVVSDSVETWTKDNVYTVGEDATSISIKAGNIGDVKLQAQWTTNLIEVKLNLGEPAETEPKLEGVSDEQVFVEYSTKNIFDEKDKTASKILPKATAVGYEFKGWYYNDTLVFAPTINDTQVWNDEKLAVLGNAVYGGEVVELTAKWEANLVKAKLNLGIKDGLEPSFADVENNEIFIEYNTKNVYDEEDKETSKIYPKATDSEGGYNFLGWYYGDTLVIDANGNLVKEWNETNLKEVMGNRVYGGISLELTARWEEA